MTAALELARAVAHAVSRRGGRAYLVGGAVRDRLLGREAKDADLEVYRVPPDALVETLRALGRVDDVGRAFGILKLTRDGVTIDVGLPRRDSKVARGHRGFDVAADPNLPEAEACARRDLTINAMLEDPLTGEVLDPFDGASDLRRRVLRHVSTAFTEDPLRVLRVCQFAARFDFGIDPATAALCRTLDVSELPPERVWDEVKKWLLRGIRPSTGMHALEETAAISAFPELAALRGVPQDDGWHPEGDVFDHTALCLDHATSKRDAVPRPLVFMLAVLFHDLGKATTTRWKDGRLRAHAHDTAGEALAKTACARLTRESAIADEVAALVRLHLRPGQLGAQDTVSDAAVRRLALEADLRMLAAVSDADGRGRVLPASACGDSGWLLEHAERLRVRDAAPKPLLLGRHLIELGVRPGPELGRVLAAVFDKQLDGEIATLDQAIEVARALIERRDDHTAQ